MDRAALDAALALGLPCGGWCPRGRLAEDGPIDPRYPLRETPSADYPQRTEWNVRDSDGTLVLTRGRPSGGTGLTISLARGQGRPVLILGLTRDQDPMRITAWAKQAGISILHVAGPRESQQPGIQDEARGLLITALESTASGP